MSHTSNPQLDRALAAVGLAMSEWETLEAHLSHLYSIFVGRPQQIDAMEEYGREARIFRDRLRLLEQNAVAYFQESPHHDHEGAFRALAAEAERLSYRRNQIAHGIIHSVPVYDSTFRDAADGWPIPMIQYCLVPPRYAVFRLTSKDGAGYSHNSDEIRVYASSFAACAAKARDLAAELCRSQ